MSSCIVTGNEAKELLRRANAAKRARAKVMPTERAAIDMLWEAWQRLRELGWREARYCPKDGSTFPVIEGGSTGVFECRYEGEWPNGHYIAWDGGDSWPSNPLLYKPTKKRERRAKRGE